MKLVIIIMFKLLRSILVLFYRDEINGKVKFDIRYIVLLRNLNPLIIYTYKVFNL
jgi:hypothetical protein